MLFDILVFALKNSSIFKHNTRISNWFHNFVGKMKKEKTHTRCSLVYIAYGNELTFFIAPNNYFILFYFILYNFAHLCACLCLQTYVFCRPIPKAFNTYIKYHNNSTFFYIRAETKICIELIASFKWKWIGKIQYYYKILFIDFYQTSRLILLCVNS